MQICEWNYYKFKDKRGQQVDKPGKIFEVLVKRSGKWTGRQRLQD